MPFKKTALRGWRKFIEFLTDQERDAESGLYNYGARLYDPVIGQFITPDTVVPDWSNPQSLNRYAYCLNNPLIYIDPTGNFFEATTGGEYDYFQTTNYQTGISFLDNTFMWAFNEVTNMCGLLANSALNTYGTLREGAVWGVEQLGGDEGDVAFAELMLAAYAGGAFPEMGTLKAGTAFESVAAESGTKLLSAPSGYSPWVGEINSVVAESDMIMYRVWGDEAAQVAGWLSPTKPSSALSAIRDLALPPGNSASYVSEVLVPAGTRYQIGTAASAFGQPGGATQVLLLDRIPAGNFGAGTSLWP